MAKTLEQLRTELARLVGRYMTGTTTGAGASLVDTSGLARITENDVLIGGIAYISEADDASPEGEWAWITDYVAATSTISLAPPLKAALDIGDSYELFLAPLHLEDWDACINEAIRSAWPEVWEPHIEEITPTGAVSYHLPVGTHEALQVELVPKAAGVHDLIPGQILARHLWTTEGVPAEDMFDLYLLRQVPSDSDLRIRVHCMNRYAELAATESTYLDPNYILAAARAAFYGMMAGHSRSEASQGAYLQQMAHWQEIAAQRKYTLAAALRGLLPEEKKGK